MHTRARKDPSYRFHKPIGPAVVRLDGRDFDRGEHGTESRHEAYRRTIAEWLTCGTARCDDRAHQAGSQTLTIGELILASRTGHGETYDRLADGTPTDELDNDRDAPRPLNRLYGHTLARDFGPLALEAVRQSMIESGLCRNVINPRVGKLVEDDRPDTLAEAMAVLEAGPTRWFEEEIESIMPNPANLFADLPTHFQGELFTTLLESATVRIERIVSHGHASPGGFWYDQDQHEWVMVLKGGARLRFEGEEQPVEMKPGDFIDIPAHTRHQVEWTTPDAPTIWLAIHHGD